jgi:putative salt-induced outer membrane protein YdiY
VRQGQKLVASQVLALLAGLLLCAPARAEEAAWAPPAPSDTEYDWIQLTSGEWLKGDFERLRDRKVYFDSDELEEQDFDFSDVAAFRLPRPHSFRVESRQVVRGSAEMRDGVVRVETESGVVELQRDELVSIVQGKGRERERWSTLLSLGVALRRGNTDQSDLTGLIQVRRESVLTRWGIDYNGVISTVNNSKTANSHRVFSGFDVFLTSRFYLTVPFFEFFSDEFQNIDQRYTPGAGLGYELVRRPWVEWDVTSGTAYQRTIYSNGGNDGDLAVLAGTEVDFDFDLLDWDNLYRLQIVPTDLGKTSQHFESVAAFDIWGPFDLDVSFIWDRITRPQPDADGNRPNSDDLRLSVGVGLDF